jgi:hypothetical protein
MADLSKFEEMLERLINEDKEGAQELFHEIVVEKSRDIYESLLEADLEDEEVDEATDEEVDESDEEVEESDEEVDESDDELEEDFDLEEFEVEADPMADMGGDATDDMLGDIEMGGDEEGEEGEEDEGEEGDMEDRVEDLEDALDDLKAEFEKMMAGEEGEEHDMGDMGDMGDEEGAEEKPEEGYTFESEDEEVDESDDEEVEETADEEVEESNAPKSAGEQMREYVEKVTASMGDNGANTKSTVAGKNDMGGTASNIAAGDTEAGVEANKGNLKGSALSDQNAKDMNTGNVNVPGGKAAKAGKSEPGHGAEKKGKPEQAADKKSIVGSK